MMGYIVDLILVLCRVLEPHGNVSRSGAQSAINSLVSSGLKKSIHDEISSFIRTVQPHFEHNGLDVVMGKIVDLISRNERLIHHQAMPHIKMIHSGG